jgi:hypothetical protein
MAKGSSSKGLPSGASPLGMNDYQAEDDHRTLSRASEIQGDKGRMGGVAKQQKKQLRSLSKVGKMIGNR